ncbi:hypothetical protein CPB84DRAFT_1780406 [Gymnopilus junonius]|uniref:Anaphase-promoting complex subunit 2 n=1 Tax=Gymnopilus junonius TaxID=109634 RepID=A0A9P5NLQ9_GYMJU|nr:hypothetical protein CPB84DRAFT_1780406 [Gymnopilus junonius]
MPHSTITDAMRAQVTSKWHESIQHLSGGSASVSGFMDFREVNICAVYADNIVPTIFICRLGRFLSGFYISSVPVDAHGRAYGIGKDLNKALKAFHSVNSGTKLGHHPKSEHTTLLSLSLFGSKDVPTYALTFQTHLFSALPPSFTSGFKALCASLLSPAFEEDSTMAMDVHTHPTLRDTFSGTSSTTPLDMTTHASLWSAIDLLGLIERHEGMILSVGQWERPMVEELRMWAADQVVPWLVWVYGRERRMVTEEARMMLYGVGSGFDYHINKTLCDLRTREIFDIIVDYPDSMGALEDLKDCIQRMDGRAALVQSLRKLERPDTIKTIVANLVGSNNDDDDDGDSDLLALVDEDDGDAPTLIQHAHERDVDDYSNLDWDPEPVDAGPEFRTNKPSDVLSTLVSIYDSPDLFVNELQALLAQRLLAITRRGSRNVISDPVEKRRKIEMLKLRFGETAMQMCEVMLRDMTDSRGSMACPRSEWSTLHPSIISRQFWPALESSGLMQEDYSREYANLKPDKKLQWLPHLGTVQIELELEDRMVEVEYSTYLRSLFAFSAVWTLDDLVGSGAVGSIDRNAALRALSTWVDHGVLREDPENMPGPERVREAIAKPAPAADVPSLSAAQLQQAEQMRVYWKFIEGMLTNLGSLRLDRIQSMLNSPGYDKTTEQLAAFLEAARREGI